jgi:cytochrome c2
MVKKAGPVSDKVFYGLLWSWLMISLSLISACAGYPSEAGVDEWRLPGDEVGRNQAFLGTVMAERVETWALHVPGGDAERGRQTLGDYGCHACHTIPGVPEADAMVGPPLTDWAQRRYIAGLLPNTPENLVKWLRYPQDVEPGTVMPNMDVTEQDARDMAAYLYTLGDN